LLLLRLLLFYLNKFDKMTPTDIRTALDRIKSIAEDALSTIKRVKRNTAEPDEAERFAKKAKREIDDLISEIGKLKSRL